MIASSFSPRCLAALLLCSALLLSPALLAEPLAVGAGRFEVSHRGRSLPVWYYLPPDAAPDTPVLFVMHGVNRNADQYRDNWVPHAARHRLLIVAPEFAADAFPGDGGYALGRQEQGAAFTFIEPVFDAVKAATGNTSERYHMFGHSAGAQFTHRYVFFMPQARLDKAVAANAGWYTMPDLETGYPYGLKGTPVGENALRQLLQRPLLVLLGADDTDPNHVHLRRTPEAMAQGEHRLARGQTFFEMAGRQAAALGVELGWKLVTAPGVAHDNARVAEHALAFLLGRQL